MLKNHYIILDFDSTFVQVEALDELAAITLAKVENSSALLAKIKQITEDGMNGTISLSQSLNSRIELLKTNKQEINQLVNLLKHKVSNSIKRNRKFLNKYCDNIFIVSNGFKEYITPIVTLYGIKEENIYANSFLLDDNDNVIGINQNHILSKDQGKVTQVKDLKLNGTVHVLGDGYTDYEIKKYGAADYFYAYTENITRQNVIQNADFITPSFDEFLYQNNFPMSISYPKNRIKILLLENIHPHAYLLLKNEGYTVESITGSLNEDELCSKIADVSVVGIRSKTTINPKVLQHADKLIAIGAFCIGTNQINLTGAEKQGIAAFNAPYSNTRSVVEMAIGEIIILQRKIIPKNTGLHNGKWNKSADNCHEIRGKKLGIVGYGNIGSQLSVLAESLGMQVYYYDLIEKLQLGNARKCHSLHELLSKVDIVTLHVDGRKENANLIGAHELSLMKDKAILLNLSRGHVVDLESLALHLKSGKLLGAAIDVFPYEPQNNQEPFVHQLCGIDNVILSPHIGGSTEEAQYNIAEFVANRIISYINTGDTTQSINLPNFQLPEFTNAHRLVHLHANVPGILAQINNILAKHKINILGQYLKTNENIGYVITDIDTGYNQDVIHELKAIDHTIRCRILY